MAADSSPVGGEVQISPEFAHFDFLLRLPMRDLFVLLVYLIATLFRLVRPSGVRTVLLSPYAEASALDREPFSPTCAKSLHFGSASRKARVRHSHPPVHRDYWCEPTTDR